MTKRAQTVHWIRDGAGGVDHIACGVRDPVGVPNKHQRTCVIARVTCRRCRQLAFAAPKLKGSKRKSPIRVEKKAPMSLHIEPGAIEQLVSRIAAELKLPERSLLGHLSGDYKPEDVQKYLEVVYHPDDFAADFFCRILQERMRERRKEASNSTGLGAPADNWQSAPIGYLTAALSEHALARRWLDVGMYAMMLFIRGRRKTVT